MNKKCLVYTLLVGFLATSFVSFSMHNMPKVIYYGSKVLASTAIPVYGMNSMYKGKKEKEEELAALPDVKSIDPIAQEWAETIMEDLGCSQHDISLKYGKAWYSCSINEKKHIVLPFR